jgi:hypothetical protein
VLVVAYKQEFLSAEKARQLGIMSNCLYDEAPFVNRSCAKQVGGSMKGSSLKAMC